MLQGLPWQSVAANAVARKMVDSCGNWFTDPPQRKELAKSATT